MLTSLAAVLFVFGLLAALLLWARRTGGGLGGLSLSVVEEVNLGGGRSVTIVRSGERYFLLGATAHSLSLIAELEPGDMAELRAAEPGTAALFGLRGAAARLQSRLTSACRK
jgi:flagellar biogenesis protein FliO